MRVTIDKEYEIASKEMKMVLEAEHKLKDNLLSLEEQIYKAETTYLEDTIHGNIMKGWEGFLDSKAGIRKEMLLNKRTRWYTCADRLFTNSSNQWMTNRIPEAATPEESALFMQDLNTKRQRGPKPKSKKRKHMSLLSS